jgi:hypothetical protein
MKREIPFRRAGSFDRLRGGGVDGFDVLEIGDDIDRAPDAGKFGSVGRIVEDVATFPPERANGGGEDCAAVCRADFQRLLGFKLDEFGILAVEHHDAGRVGQRSVDGAGEARRGGVGIVEADNSGFQPGGHDLPTCFDAICKLRETGDDEDTVFREQV